MWMPGRINAVILRMAGIDFILIKIQVNHVPARDVSHLLIVACNFYRLRIVVVDQDRNL